MAEAEAEQLPPGVELDAKGNRYMRDAKGALRPIENVKQSKKLEDQLVRKLFAKAERLSEQMGAFKAKTFIDVDAFLELLAERYGDNKGGIKGNVSLTSFDGLFMLKIQVSDRIKFGPELLIAANKVDECLAEWSADTGPELRTIIKDAFRQDKEGTVQTGKLLGLLQHDIQDARWQEAMRALKDSIVVDSTARYQRFYRREKPTDKWRPLSLDMATV